MPTEVTVTYIDKTTGTEKVEWDYVDTSKLGTFIAKGTVGNSGFKMSVEIQVVNQDYIHNIDVRSNQFMNVHTIVLNAALSVYSITINDLSVNSYDGDNQFSYVTTSFAKDLTVYMTDMAIYW